MRTTVGLASLEYVIPHHHNSRKLYFRFLFEEDKRREVKLHRDLDRKKRRGSENKDAEQVCTTLMPLILFVDCNWSKNKANKSMKNVRYH